MSAGSTGISTSTAAGRQAPPAAPPPRGPLFGEPSRTERPKSPSAVLVSIGVHLVVGVALVRVLTLPFPIDAFFSREPDSSRSAERIKFVTVPPPPAGSVPAP